MLLARAGGKSSKIAVYDDAGDSVHAIVRVETERGPYLVDVLFDFIHEDAVGGPILEPEFADPRILVTSIERAKNHGMGRAHDYPIQRYPLNHLRSLNWDKNLISEALYILLVAVLGEERADHLPRPYLSEEPALMLMVIATFLAAICGAGISGHGVYSRRRSSRDAHPT